LADAATVATGDGGAHPVVAGAVATASPVPGGAPNITGARGVAIATVDAGGGYGESGVVVAARAGGAAPG